MATIPNTLADLISNNPDKELPVLITLKEETLPPSLNNKGRFIMENKIFSAKISGREIVDLKDDPRIEAIEPDMEMQVL